MLTLVVETGKFLGIHKIKRSEQLGKSGFDSQADIGLRGRVFSGLGRYDDDTVCTLSSIDGCRRSILQDRNTLYIIGIDVRKRSDCIHDSVNDDQGLIGCIYGTCTPDIDGRSGCRVTGHVNDISSGYTPLKCLIHGKRRRLNYILHLHGSYRARQVRFLRLTKTDDNDLVEVLRIRLHLDGKGGLGSYLGLNSLVAQHFETEH